jgi:hypothetical protein
MSDIKIVRCSAAVTFVFKADQPRCTVPFNPESAAVFEKKLSLVNVQYLPTDQSIFWVYSKGYCKLSEKRKLAMGPIQASENEISVTVEGSSEDAIDVLQEVWSTLGELAEVEPVRLDETLGSFAYATTAVVELPKTHAELFPGLAVLARHTREGVGDSRIGVPGVDFFRVETRTTFAVGALSAERATVIEPRFTSKAEDRIFFTQSPLKSDLHMAMLEELCRSPG